MKKYEITVEVEAVDGSQVFACYAESELEAKLKYSRGECEIIEQQIEVLGLDAILEICESDDISSRLPQDVEYDLRKENQQLAQDKAELVEALEQISEYNSMIQLHISSANTHDKEHIMHYVERVESWCNQILKDDK